VAGQVRRPRTTISAAPWARESPTLIQKPNAKLIPAHPHIHALVAEGVFLPERGAFLPLPKLVTEPFLKLAFGLHSVVCQFDRATAREAVLGAWWVFRSPLP